MKAHVHTFWEVVKAGEVFDNHPIIAQPEFVYGCARCGVRGRVRAQRIHAQDSSALCHTTFAVSSKL